MKSLVVIKNANIVTPDEVLQGDVLVENGTIVRIHSGSRIVYDGEVIDAEGGYLLPGLIDLHGDDIEHELGALGSKYSSLVFPVEMGLLQTDKNAAAWGITTKVHAIAYFEEERKGRSVRLSRQIVDTIERYQSRGALLVEHLVDLRYEITGDPGYTIDLMSHPLVKMVACMDHTPGEGQFKDDEHYIQRNLQYMTKEELQHLIREKQDNKVEKIRNILQVAEKAREQNMMLAFHDINTVEKVEFMNDAGARFAEMPITFEAARKASELGWTVAMSAVNIVRGGSSSGHLNAQEGIENGLVDCLCSDYYLPSIINAVFVLVKKGILSLPEAVRLVTLNPAAALNLTDRGSIEIGKTADMVLLNSSFEFPVIRATIKQGRVVYQDDRNLSAEKKGEQWAV
jgi:alpha-D-ribose 1-methylphosphonate 5-triphosphate diphosphatase